MTHIYKQDYADKGNAIPITYVDTMEECPICGQPCDGEHPDLGEPSLTWPSILVDNYGEIVCSKACARELAERYEG